MLGRVKGQEEGWTLLPYGDRLRANEMANAVIPELRYTTDHGIARLATHDVILCGDSVTLRPMTEDDWEVLLEWNNDPEVMELVESEGFSARSLSEIQSIYRWISTHSYCFIMEVEGQGIGECWLQRMNLRRIVEQFPGEDLWRVDLMIGVKELWGRGYGSEAVRLLLVEFGFGRVGANAIFGLVSARNTRSVRTFKKCGFGRYGEEVESGVDLLVTAA